MRRRIVICLALLLALCVLGDVTAMLCLRSSVDELSALAESHRIQTLRADLASSSVRLERDALATADAAAGNKRNTVSHADSFRRFEQSIDACAGCHHREAIQRQLDRVRSTYQAYRDHITLVDDTLVDDTLVDDTLADDTQETLTGNVQEASPPNARPDTAQLLSEVVGLSTAMADLAAKHLGIESNRAQANVDRAWLALFGSIIASLVVGGVIALHLKSHLTKPVEALLAGINRVQQGDLNYQFTIEADEEFRRLGEAFNRAYESLQTAHDGMVQAEKMAAIGNMAAGIAHEVGNPLASISSVVQMMLRDSDSDKSKERAKLIMHHIGRVSQIVRELLTFARPTNGSKACGKVVLNELLDETISLLQYDQRAKQTQIVCHYDTPLTLEEGEPDRLRLVFTNIVLNALDALVAANRDDARLEISADSTDNKVTLRFKDNGPGMSDEQIRNAFEPFYTTKDPGAGTGLGLWICYQVVRKHHGDIRIESELGQGATVVIELPRLATDAHEAIQQSRMNIPARTPPDHQAKA